MRQILVTLDESTSVQSIRRAISLLRGVKATSVYKEKKKVRGGEMMVDIRLGTEFKRQFKRLMKKYPSLLEDLKTFKQDLEINPQQGVALGAHLYKVRMAIASKGKGKSAGARVITYRILVKQECIEITLLTIYDKNEIENVSDEYLQSLVEEMSRQ